MTKSETKAWCDYHRSLFSDWRDWFDKQSQEAIGICLLAWTKALKAIDMNDAREASDRMSAGVIKKPFHPSEHVAAIRDCAVVMASDRWREQRPKFEQGRKVVDCIDCHDTGWVYCEGDNDKRFTVICRCKAGEKHLGREWGSIKAEKDFTQPRYDPVRCKRLFLIDDLEVLSKAPPSQFAHDFDEWSK